MQPFYTAVNPTDAQQLTITNNYFIIFSLMSLSISPLIDELKTHKNITVL